MQERSIYGSEQGEEGKMYQDGVLNPFTGTRMRNVRKLRGEKTDYR